MGKIQLTLSILGLLVLACDSTILIPATPTIPAPVALPTDTLAATSTPTPSATPLPSTTPTMEASPTSTGTMVTLTLAATAATASQIPATPQGPVFDSVTISATQMTWGAACPSSTVKFIAHAIPGFGVKVVLLFTRLQSQDGSTTTNWNSPTSMHSDGQGTFEYELAPRQIRFYQDFKLAWVQYQLVATNSQEQVVGRTDVYQNNLAISRCP